MSVNKQDIDLKKALEASAGVSKSVDKSKKAEVPKDLSSALLESTNLKKKDTPLPPSEKPSDVPPDGDAPGTTSTIQKWEDNPLNPVKAINEYEAKRDKTPDILFKDEDKIKLDKLLTKTGIAPAPPVTKPLSWIEDPSQTTVPQPKVKSSMQIEYENAENIESKLRSQLENLKTVRQQQRGAKKSETETEIENDLKEVQVLKRKAFMEMAESGDKEVVVLSRQDDTGNSFKRTMQDMFGSKPGAWQTEKPKIEDKLAKMPTQFLTGLNVLKGIEPVEWERVTDAITNGLPISQSQTAKITNLGISLEEAKLQRDIIKSPVTKAERETVADISKELETVKTDIEKYEGIIKSKQPLSAAQVQDYESKIQQYNATVTKYKPLIEKVNTVDGAFAKRANQLQETRMKNLVDNPEVLRSFIADGVANKLDELGKIKQVPGSPQKTVSDFMFGHTWNYSPEQIKSASEQYLKEQGIDPSTPQAQAAIKYLQENEGVMLGENSIAKAGGFREFGAGLIEPIEGVSKFIDSKTRSLNDIYAESQSQGNVQASRKRLESEEQGLRGVMNEVLKGTGQFVSQAAMMAGTSGAIGTFAKGIMGRSGVQMLADAKAAGIKPIIPFDDATANIVAGKFLNSIKDPMAVFTTSYAMSYDGNLKAALSYTSDNNLAKNAAMFNASMEGATELFLSPLDIARGIYSKFSKSQTKDLLKILSDKSLKDDPSALKQYVGRFVKGVLGTAKVSGAEIMEEYVTQISDYVTNMYLNPESDSFKNRSLGQELMTTTYQTGLSMALPALLNGIGAARANSFSKGSLMVAAQNRQAMVDNLNTDLAAGKILPEYATEQIQLINTAAVANAQLPKKANGADLNTDEKANYIWSRTTEAYMENKMVSTDAAAKELWKDKIAKQQEYRKQIIGLAEEQPEVPEYLIDDKPVGREEFMRTIEEKPDGNYVVTGDDEAQAALRKIGGVDDKTDSEVTSAVITINGKQYEGKNHAEAILKAKAEGQDISRVDRKRDGKFKLADGTIIDRAEAKKRFGQDRSELLIEQDEAADKANQEYRKSDKDLVTEVESKAIPGYERTSIKELKEQALQAPDSFKNQFDDEQLTIDLIAKNTEQQIKDAIAYQQGRIENDPNMDEVSLEGIDRHIQLLEKGLEQVKQLAKEEEIKPVQVSEQGQPLSKLQQGAAKALIAKEKEVPGETLDDKLRYITEQPEGTFGKKLTTIANERFPKKETPTQEGKVEQPSQVGDVVVDKDLSDWYDLSKEHTSDTKEEKDAIAKLQELKKQAESLPDPYQFPENSDERISAINEIQELNNKRQGLENGVMQKRLQRLKETPFYQTVVSAVNNLTKKINELVKKGGDIIGDWTPKTGVTEAEFNKLKNAQAELRTFQRGEIPTPEKIKNALAVEQSLSKEQPSQVGDVVVDKNRVVHAGEEIITAIDESKLQSRDKGEYGKGFYVSKTETNQPYYGKIKSYFDINTDAKVLNEKTFDIEDWKRNETNNSGYKYEDVLKEPEKYDYEDLLKVKSFEDAVNYDKKGMNDYARKKGFDVFEATPDEIVILNKDAVKPVEQSLSKEQPSLSNVVEGKGSGVGGEQILAYDETETETIKGLTGKRISIGDYTGIVTFASVEKGKFELHDEKGQIKKVHFKNSELVDENDVPVTLAKKSTEPKKSEPPAANELSPEDAAKDLIRAYVLRGDSLKSLIDGQGGVAGARYDAHIGGYADGKKIKSDQIAVTSINNKKLEPAAIFSLKKLFDEIKSEQNEPSKKQQTTPKETGGSSTKSGKSTKPEKIKTFKKRAKATIKSPLYLKALEIESNEPRVSVLQYFIAGGRIHRQAFEKLFGGNSGRKSVADEIKAHFQLQGKHGPRTVERLGEDLWNEADEQTQEKYDSQDFSNAVESVLLDHNSRTSMAEELAKYEEKGDEDWQKYYDNAHENLDEDEQREVDKAISILEGLSDEEIQQILDTEQEALADSDFIEQLSNQYDGIETSQADIELAEKNKKIAEIEKEKQAKINKATKPQFVPKETGIEMEDLAKSTEANRQQHNDLIQKRYSLEELIKCLWG